MQNECDLAAVTVHRLNNIGWRDYRWSVDQTEPQACIVGVSSQKLPDIELEVNVAKDFSDFLMIQKMMQYPNGSHYAKRTSK